MVNIVIFVDYDDTLLPTQLLLKDKYFFKFGKIAENTREELIKLEETVIKLLDNLNSKSNSNTYVVTNAEMNWVNESTRLYFPDMYKILNNYKIISASDLFGKKFPKSMTKWKFEVFKQIIDKIKESNDFDHTSTLHLISISDGKCENEAVDMFGKDDTMFFKKITTFKNNSIESLKKQLDLINDKIDYVIDHDGDMNIKLKKLS